MSDINPDPTGAMREEVAQVRDALRNLRESVVLRVMHRNKLQEEVTRLERLTAELDSKAGQAERLGNPQLAAEIREEHARRVEELERFRARLTQSEAEAEAAKIRMPEDEATLLRQINDIQARTVRAAAAQVEANVPGGLGTSADEMWERASGRIADLRREADARDEVNMTRSSIQREGTGTASPATPRIAPPDADRSAEQMLSALEQRLGLAAAPDEAAGRQIGEPPSLTQASYLELDDAPALADTSSDTAPQAPNAALQPTAQSVPQLNTPHSAPLLSPAPGNGANANSEQTPNDKADAEPQSLSAEQTERAAATLAALAAPAVTARSGPAAFQILSKQRESPRMETTDRVRVAAIGTGNIFRGAHLPCYPDIAQAQLVAICDPDKSAQDLAYKKYQSLMEAKIHKAVEADDMAAVERLERDLETVQLCDDITEVIETVKPDLMDICTQPLLHTPLAIQALEAGFHVMCEKPISRSWLESQQLIETIERTGKFYQHNENWLFDPDYYTVKKLVDAGAIGELAMMFLTQAHGGPEGNPRFWNPDFGGGGALLDNGIHAIGAAWFIAGLHKRPTLVKAAEPFGMSIRMPDRIIDGKYQHITVDDDAHILIRFEDPDTSAWTTAHVEGSWSEQDSPDTVYIGTTGSIKVVQEDGKRFAVVTDIKGKETRRFPMAGSNWQHWPSSFYGEILNMVQCIRNNQQSLMTAQFGADCSAIVGASYLSEKNGKRGVTLDEFKRFASDIAARYPNDPTGANNALVDALLSAVRDK